MKLYTLIETYFANRSQFIFYSEMQFHNIKLCTHSLKENIFVELIILYTKYDASVIIVTKAVRFDNVWPMCREAAGM